MQARKFLGKESVWFILLVLVELYFCLFLIFTHRIPGGHDSFQYFTLQYYFLNNVVNSGQIPQWIPFMTQGTVANFWYFLQAGLFQNILLNSPLLFKNINFLIFFNLGIFIDKLILLIGVWLLAKRFFSSIFTVFFVALTSLASSIWVSQIWWNFHLYYALPLILYLLHTFLDKKKWIYLFLAGSLLAIQTLGSLFYFLPITTLVIFLYFLFYSIFNFKEVVQDIKNLKWSWFSFVSLFSIIFLLILIYLALKVGTGQLIKYNPERNLDGTVSLGTFLYYAGSLNLAKWIELFSGISPTLDYTLYLGIICPALIILGLIFNLKKRYLHFFLLTATLLFFSRGTLLSVFFYYSWPFMKFFRHLALVSPLVRFFLCFLAGFGLEAILVYNKKEWKGLSFISLVTLAFLTLGISVILLKLTSEPYVVKFLIKKTIEPGCSFLNYLTKEIIFVISGLPFLNKIFNDYIIVLRIIRTAVFGLVLSILLGSVTFIKVKKYRTFLVGIFLFFHLLDVYSYKFSENILRTKSLTKEQYRITDFQNMPYPKKRSTSFWEDNPRASMFVEPKTLHLNSKKLSLYGSTYWTNNAFFFKDQLNSLFRTESWLLPLDNLMRAYWGQSLSDLSVKPKGLNLLYEGLKFPSENPSVFKIAGVDEDKIQFFSKAYLINQDEKIASEITNPDYKGDILFLSYPKNNKIKSKILRWSSDKPLSLNFRLRLSYKIVDFDSNNLRLIVNNPKRKSVWLFYSDVWHPFWKVKVNGKNTEVFKANLAYKAIRLKPGLNKVHFYFNSPVLVFIQKFFGLSALFWLGFVVLLTIKISVGDLK